MENVRYWTQVGAVGQIACSIATFLAVALSLWIVLSERKESIRFTVGERLIVPGDINGPMPIISFYVVNMGINPVRIITFGWQAGWLRRGPAPLKKRYAIQTGGQGLPGNETPFDLEPGHSQSFLVDGTKFFLDLDKKEFFAFRRLPFLGLVYPRICESVNAARGTTVVVSVEKPLRTSLKSRITIPS